jgi:CRISPR-associated endoribonuclease Cas2 subtype I-E
MIIVIGTNIPARVRGVLQLWMIEVKAGVLIGNVNNVIENRIIKFVEPYLNKSTDLMVIRSDSSIQGFSLKYGYNSDDKLHHIHGLQLSSKKVVDRVEYW